MKLFDNLNNIREHLINSPISVKNSFNKVVNHLTLLYDSDNWMPTVQTLTKKNLDERRKRSECDRKFKKWAVVLDSPEAIKRYKQMISQKYDI